MTTEAPFLRMSKKRSFQHDVRFESWLDRRNHGAYEHDFEYGAGSTLPAWLATQDTSAAGTPTLDYVANSDLGTYTLTHDATNEQQNLTLYGGDSKPLPIANSPWLICCAKLNTAGATMSADQRLVMGLASNRNAALDSVVTHAWFRLEGANWNILTETDDGTTDDDDNDSALDWSDAAYAWFRIRVNPALAVTFEVDLDDGNGWQTAGATLSLAAATGNVQPFIELQRDAGAEAEALTIDYLAVGCRR